MYSNDLKDYDNNNRRNDYSDNRNSTRNTYDYDNKNRDRGRVEHIKLGEDPRRKWQEFNNGKNKKDS